MEQFSDGSEAVKLNSKLKMNAVRCICVVLSRVPYVKEKKNRKLVDIYLFSIRYYR